MVNLSKEQIAAGQELVSGKFSKDFLEQINDIAVIVMPEKDNDVVMGQIYANCLKLQQIYNNDFKPSLEKLQESFSNTEEARIQFDQKLQVTEVPQVSADFNAGNVAPIL